MKKEEKHLYLCAQLVLLCVIESPDKNDHLQKILSLSEPTQRAMMAIVQRIMQGPHHHDVSDHSHVHTHAHNHRSGRSASSKRRGADTTRLTEAMPVGDGFDDADMAEHGSENARYGGRRTTVKKKVGKIKKKSTFLRAPTSERG